MNANEIQDELAQAAYELAEAERHERSAKALRSSVGKRVAKSHLFFTEALAAAKEAKIASQSLLKSQCPRTK